MLKTHGVHMDKQRSTFMRAFRAMHKIVQTKHGELKTICNQNRYTLDFIENQAGLTSLKAIIAAAAAEDTIDETTAAMVP